MGIEKKVCLSVYVSADQRHACPYPFILHAENMTHPGTVTRFTPMMCSITPLLFPHVCHDLSRVVC